jgi:peptidoglycan hydrolase CwlO-like protein
VDAVEKELSNLSNQLTVARSEIGSLNTQIDDLSNTIVIISMSGL